MAQRTESQNGQNSLSRIAIEGSAPDIDTRPTVPFAAELDRHTVPPVLVDSNRTVSSADTAARTFTPDMLSLPRGFTAETFSCPTKTAGTSFSRPSAWARAEPSPLARKPLRDESAAPNSRSSMPD